MMLNVHRNHKAYQRRGSWGVGMSEFKGSMEKAFYMRGGVGVGGQDTVFKKCGRKLWTKQECLCLSLFLFSVAYAILPLRPCLQLGYEIKNVRQSTSLSEQFILTELAFFRRKKKTKNPGWGLGWALGWGLGGGDWREQVNLEIDLSLWLSPK